jgi:hypothetical protein
MIKMAGRKKIILPPPILLLLGDRNQAINEFLGADKRFLTMAKSIWNNDIVELPLATTYRLTKPMAAFINEVVLGDNRLVAVKEGVPVVYIRSEFFKMEYPVSVEIFKLLRSGVKPKDIFVLAMSVKNKFIRNLENRLVANHIDVFVTNDTEEKISESVLEGKLIITTVNQSKGRERPYVFVWGFDSSYYSVATDVTYRDRCTSALYVAITRASKKLYVCDGDVRLPFLKKSIDQMSKTSYVQVIGNDTSEKPYKEKLKTSIHDTSPTQLIAHLPTVLTHELTTLVKSIIKLVKPVDEDNVVDIPVITSTPSSTSEIVSDLIGVAIPAMYEQKTTLNNTIELYVRGLSLRSASPASKILLKHVESLPPKCTTVADFLYLANIYSASTEQLMSRLEKLKVYNWLKQETVDECFNNLEIINVIDLPSVDSSVDSPSLLSLNKYEYGLNINKDQINAFIYEKFGLSIGIINFSAVIDVLGLHDVYELKCVQDINLGHKLQLIIYSWLWNFGMKEVYGNRNFKLLNIRTGEMWQINYNHDIASEIVYKLLDNKYSIRTMIDDLSFLRLI